MKLNIPSGDFKAYLFDCDGTIVDSMPLHYVAWKRALDAWGCPFPEEQFYAWGGRPVEGIIAELNQTHGLAMPVAETATIKERYYTEMLTEVQPIAEVVEEIHRHHGRIPFAVVSGSTRDSVEASLNTLGLLDKFDTLVCAGDYAHGKPHPEPFLLAAKRLGVAPEHCLVFEDAETGVAAAKAAGMAWVKVALPHERIAAAV
jgi:HAD superfamily hydrolase (TIGR01509 family)